VSLHSDPWSSRIRISENAASDAVTGLPSENFASRILRV
jgi:hypothetical protein